MSVVLNPVITQDGQAGAFNANNTGTELVITHIAFGIGSYDPSGTETALLSEVKRVTIASGARIAPAQIRMSALWASDTDNYPVNEIGIYAADLLVAVWSRSTGGPLGYKTPGVDFVFFYDWLLTVIPPGSLNILVDTGQSALLLALGEHTGDEDAHPQYLKRKRLIWCGEAGGTADAILLGIDAADEFDDYEEGQVFLFTAAAVNTGAVTVAAGAHGTLALTKQGAIPLDPNDLAIGALYAAGYDGTSIQIMGGLGGGASGIMSETEILVSGSEDTFTVTYNPGSMFVILNGRTLSPSDYTATDGETITLDTPAEDGDSLLVVSINTYATANAVDLTSNQSIGGVKTFLNPPIVPNRSVGDNGTAASNTAFVQQEISARVASDTAAGIIELATNAETQAGASSVLAVSPASLAARTATASRTGLIEIATQTEVNDGVDGSRAVTPATLAGYFDAYFEASFITRASVSFNGISTAAKSYVRSGSTVTVSHVAHGYAVGDLLDIASATDAGINSSGANGATVASVLANSYTFTTAATGANGTLIVRTRTRKKYNVTRVERVATGIYKVYFAVATPDADYIVSGSADSGNGITMGDSTYFNTAYVKINVNYIVGGGALVDSEIIAFSVIG